MLSPREIGGWISREMDEQDLTPAFVADQASIKRVRFRRLLTGLEPAYTRELAAICLVLRSQPPDPHRHYEKPADILSECVERLALATGLPADGIELRLGIGVTIRGETDANARAGAQPLEK